MGIQKFFSRPFKKLKGKLLGSRRKQAGRSGIKDGTIGGNIGAEGGEPSQSNSGAVGSGPVQEGNGVDRNTAAPIVLPSTSTPLISQSRTPDGV